MAAKSKEALENRRRSTLERGRATSRLGADIGEIAKPLNPDRREACRLDLAKFLVEYFPQSTGLSPFSDDHNRVIGRIQDCILRGGRFINAVYRGFAKSTISENSLLWAMLYGHRRFGAIFAAEADLATKAITSIKLELAENDLLFEDFPEVCDPIRKLERMSQRARSAISISGLVSAAVSSASAAAEPRAARLDAAVSRTA